jgi:hypothetical protein
MDPITITLMTVGALALVGLAWMSGYDIGKASERQLANRRVNGVLGSVAEIVAKENARKPRKRTTQRARK